MKKRQTYTTMILLLLAIFLAIAMTPLGQNAWIYMTGAVRPYSSSTLDSADHNNLLLSVGGNRWVSMHETEEATAYHALVIPPQVALRQDSSVSNTDNISHIDTLKWLCPRGPGGDYQSADTKSLTFAYNSLTQGVTIGDDTYKLKKGNVFIVRLDEAWLPHVTQIEARLYKAESDEVIDFLKRALPDDEAVKKLWR